MNAPAEQSTPLLAVEEHGDRLELRGELNIRSLAVAELLVVPRVIGLCITLPLLTVYADLMGLVGGAVSCYALLDVSLLQYVERVRHAVDGSDLFVGLFKAPVFALVIAVAGCMHGLHR